MALVCAMLAPSAANEESAPAEADGPKSQFVLLHNGGVSEGIVCKLETRIAVQKSAGTIYYDSSDVAKIGNSIAELYEFQDKQLPVNDVHARKKLFEWCMQHKLFESAAKELEKVLAVDPGNREAEQKLKFLRDRLEQVQKPAKPPIAALPRRSVGPDPSDVIENFIRGHGQDAFNGFRGLELRIINSCGSVGCHGGLHYDGKFRLSSAKVLDQRMHARNLESFKSGVDLEDPNSSVLLYQAIRPHGGRTLPPLGGVNDPVYRDLRDWVFKVSSTWSTIETEDADLAKREGKASSFGSARPGGLAEDFGRPRAPATMPGNVPTSRPGFSAAADDAPPERASKPARAQKSAQKKTTEADDPFDPASFNQSAKPVDQPDGEIKPGTSEAMRSENPAAPASPPAVPADTVPFKPAKTIFDLLRRRKDR